MKGVACAASRSLNSNFQAANDKKGTMGSTIIFFIFLFSTMNFYHSKTLVKMKNHFESDCKATEKQLIAVEIMGNA